MALIVFIYPCHTGQILTLLVFSCHCINPDSSFYVWGSIRVLLADSTFCVYSLYCFRRLSIPQSCILQHLHPNSLAVYVCVWVSGTTRDCFLKVFLYVYIGFEPTLPEGNWFRVSCLNYLATTAHTNWSIVGSVVECSLATRAALVRFLDDADIYIFCMHIYMCSIIYP